MSIEGLNARMSVQDGMALRAMARELDTGGYCAEPDEHRPNDGLWKNHDLKVTAPFSVFPGLTHHHRQCRAIHRVVAFCIESHRVVTEQGGYDIRGTVGTCLKTVSVVLYLQESFIRITFERLEDTRQVGVTITLVETPNGLFVLGRIEDTSATAVFEIHVSEGKLANYQAIGRLRAARPPLISSDITIEWNDVRNRKLLQWLAHRDQEIGSLQGEYRQVLKNEIPSLLTRIWSPLISVYQQEGRNGEWSHYGAVDATKRHIMEPVAETRSPSNDIQPLRFPADGFTQWTPSSVHEAYPAITPHVTTLQLQTDWLDETEPVIESIERRTMHIKRETTTDDWINKPINQPLPVLAYEPMLTYDVHDAFIRRNTTPMIYLNEPFTRPSIASTNTYQLARLRPDDLSLLPDYSQQRMAACLEHGSGQQADRHSASYWGTPAQNKNQHYPVVENPREIVIKQLWSESISAGIRRRAIGYRIEALITYFLDRTPGEIARFGYDLERWPTPALVGRYHLRVTRRPNSLTMVNLTTNVADENPTRAQQAESLAFEYAPMFRGYQARDRHVLDKRGYRNVDIGEKYSLKYKTWMTKDMSARPTILQADPPLDIYRPTRPALRQRGKIGEGISLSEHQTASANVMKDSENDPYLTSEQRSCYTTQLFRMARTRTISYLPPNLQPRRPASRAPSSSRETYDSQAPKENLRKLYGRSSSEESRSSSGVQEETPSEQRLKYRANRLTTTKTGPSEPQQQAPSSSSKDDYPPPLYPHPVDLPNESLSPVSEVTQSKSSATTPPLLPTPPSSSQQSAPPTSTPIQSATQPTTSQPPSATAITLTPAPTTTSQPRPTTPATPATHTLPTPNLTRASRTAAPLPKNLPPTTSTQLRTSTRERTNPSSSSTCQTAVTSPAPTSTTPTPEITSPVLSRFVPAAYHFLPDSLVPGTGVYERRTELYGLQAPAYEDSDPNVCPYDVDSPAPLCTHSSFSLPDCPWTLRHYTRAREHIIKMKEGTPYGPHSVMVLTEYKEVQYVLEVIWRQCHQRRESRMPQRIPTALEIYDLRQILYPHAYMSPAVPYSVESPSSDESSDELPQPPLVAETPKSAVKEEAPATTLPIKSRSSLTSTQLPAPLRIATTTPQAPPSHPPTASPNPTPATPTPTIPPPARDPLDLARQIDQLRTALNAICEALPSYMTTPDCPLLGEAEPSIAIPTAPPRIEGEATDPVFPDEESASANPPLFQTEARHAASQSTRPSDDECSNEDAPILWRPDLAMPHHDSLPAYPTMGQVMGRAENVIIQYHVQSYAWAQYRDTWPVLGQCEFGHLVRHDPLHEMGHHYCNEGHQLAVTHNPNQVSRPSRQGILRTSGLHIYVPPDSDQAPPTVEERPTILPAPEAVEDPPSPVFSALSECSSYSVIVLLSDESSE